MLDRGYWTAFTLYPGTKMGNERMVEVVKQYGSERIICDSSADWGKSDVLAVPKTAALMQKHGIDDDIINKVTYENALTAYAMSGEMKEDDWLNPAPIDQRNLHQGNSVLRGGQTPKIEDVLEEKEKAKSELLIE